MCSSDLTDATDDQALADIRAIVSSFGADVVALPAERHDALVRSKTGAIDVSDALDDVDVPVLWDWAHTNELGARTVAEAMYAHLAPEFDELTGSH